MSQKEIFSLVKKFAGQTNIIAVPRFFVELCGNIEAAIIMSQLLYWTDRTTTGWVAKSYKEWTAETGLTERQIRYAVAKLKKLNFVVTKVKRFAGSPTVHYRVHPDKMSESILTKCQNPFDKMSESITKITTKITTNLSPLPLSHSKNVKVNHDDMKERERIIKKIKKYFPNTHIPKNIPTEKVDYLLYMIEEGKVIPEKIQSLIAYLKGLTLLEHFPSFREREKITAETEKRKTEGKEKEKKEQTEVDFLYNLIKLRELKSQLNERR